VRDERRGRRGAACAASMGRESQGVERIREEWPVERIGWEDFEIGRG